MDSKLEFRCDVMKLLKKYRIQQAEEQRRTNQMSGLLSSGCKTTYATNTNPSQHQQMFQQDFQSRFHSLSPTSPAGPSRSIRGPNVLSKQPRRILVETGPPGYGFRVDGPSVGSFVQGNSSPSSQLSVSILENNEDGDYTQL